VVTGPGFAGIGGCVGQLGYGPATPLTADVARSLSSLLNDVWCAGRRDAQRKIREAIGLSDWGGDVRVER
jgi:hypothetical protein